MNGIVIILMGIFTLIIFFLIFIVMAYLYDNQKNYKININNNLLKSEKQINYASHAFNKLQKTIINDVKRVNSNLLNSSNTVNDNISTLNSNIVNNIFNITSNNSPITDIYTKKIISDFDVNLNHDLNTWSSLTVHTNNSSKYFNLCDTNTNLSEQRCISMNIDDSGIFNIFSSNFNTKSKNVNGINIYNSNNGILASFDNVNNKILLGSNVNAAISIVDNVYTPQIINANYILVPSINNQSALLKIRFISNHNIQLNTFISFNINTLQAFNIVSTNLYQYSNNILKYKTPININKDTIYNLTDIPINSINQNISSENGSMIAYASKV
jgi:hypothetical protein